MLTEKRVVEHFLTLEEGGGRHDITEEKVHLVSGICTLIEIIFPPGPAGLVGVRALQGVHQLIPESNKLWLTGDDITYPHAAPVDLLTNTKTLRVLGYNEDEEFPHTIIFRFTVATLIDDPAAAIEKLLKDRLPGELPFYIKVLPDMLTEIVNTKLILENYIVPLLGEMNKRDETRWRSEIKDKPMEELARL